MSFDKFYFLVFFVFGLFMIYYFYSLFKLVEKEENYSDDLEFMSDKCYSCANCNGIGCQCLDDKKQCDYVQVFFKLN